MGFEPTTSELEVQRASPLRHSGIARAVVVLDQRHDERDTSKTIAAEGEGDARTGSTEI